MNISLTPELEQYVNKQVKSGFYHSSSEVINAAIHLLIQSEISHINSAVHEDYKMWLKQEVQVGLGEAACGKLISRDKLKEHIDKRRQEFNSKKIVDK